MTTPPEENPFRPPNAVEGMPPMPPAYVPPAPPPKKTNVLNVALVVLALIVIAGFVITGMNRRADSKPVATPTTATTTTTSPPKYVAADCLWVSGIEAFPKVDEVDCASPDANYTVAKQVKSGESCGDGYSKYTEGSLRICLMPLFADGQCYNLSLASLSLSVPKIDCSPFVVKVTVLRDVVDVAACGPNVGKALAYPEMKLTYCLNQGT